MKKIGLYSLIFLLIDQVLKFVISNNLILNEPVSIIKDFFNLTYVKNTGAAFSILEGNRIFLIASGILAILLIYIFFLKNKQISKLEILLYSLLIGGILGNLLDRIIFGYVIDYLDFRILNYNAPIFNFADSCIVVSCIIIIFLTLKEEIYDRNKSRGK